MVCMVHVRGAEPFLLTIAREEDGLLLFLYTRNRTLRVTRRGPPDANGITHYYDAPPCTTPSHASDCECAQLLEK